MRNTRPTMLRNVTANTRQVAAMRRKLPAAIQAGPAALLSYIESLGVRAKMCEECGNHEDAKRVWAVEAEARRALER